MTSPILKKIIVVGATGFTGSRVMQELANVPDIEVTCLVRSPQKLQNWQGANPLTIIEGDLDNVASMQQAFKGQDALIFVASMGFGHMPDVVRVGEEAGVKKAVFTSSTAIFTRLPAQSKDGREGGEAAVKQAQFDWTILRPTMIFGCRGDRNMERMVRTLKKTPLFMVPGSGQALQQPIFVGDVAKAVVAALFAEGTENKAYNISGKEPLTFNQLVKKTGAALGKSIPIINVPLWMIMPFVKLYNAISKKPRLTEEQILRLNENKAFDHQDAMNDFGFQPRPFEEGIENLISELKSN